MIRLKTGEFNAPFEFILFVIRTGATLGSKRIVQIQQVGPAHLNVKENPKENPKEQPEQGKGKDK